MKKIALAIGLLFFAFGGIIAQDLKKIRTAVTLSRLPGAGTDKIEAARTEVDKLVADPKGQTLAEAWLMKSQVYGMIAGHQTLKTTYPNAATEGFNALQKYLELEPAATTIAEQGFIGLNDIYKTFFDEGIKNYNTKNWTESHNNFQKLVTLGDIMISRKWTNTQFDTTAYLFAGVTAQNAQQEETATKFYRELADRKVTGSDYEHIYAFLTNYYSNTKRSEEDFRKYLALSREVYPDKKYWADMEFDFNTSGISAQDVLKQYEEASAAGKLSASQYFDYGNYFVSDKKVRELADDEKLKFLERSVEAFIKSVELDSTNMLAVYNAGVTNYSLWESAYDDARAIRGTTADIKARRAKADKATDAAADKSIEWLEKAYARFAAKTEKDKVEENSQKTSARFLAALYEYKRERAKGNEAAYDKWDKKFKFYEAKY